ncbi:MAG: site-specific integrase [Chloroflexi bacterium]|nr:site-specific integrase [Chloroflexota bacterium]
MSNRAPGEGSFQQRKDGRWMARLQMGGRRVAVYGETRSEAVQKLKTLSGTAEKTHRLPASNKLTLGDYLTDWLSQAEPRLRPKTWDRYELVIRLHVVPQLGTIPLAKVSPLMLAHHYTRLSKNTGAPSVQKTHRVLHKALGDATRWGLVTSNVAALVDAPKAEPKQVNLWTPEQVAGFLKAMIEGEGGQYGYLFAFLLASGCREGEAMGLTWEDVTWDSGAVRIERQISSVRNKPVQLPCKTKAGRRAITLPAWGVEVLRRQKVAVAEWRLQQGEAWQGGQRVFPTSTGTVPTRSYIRRTFRATCKRLGLPIIRVHDLRHISLSLLAMNGVPLKVAQARAGHSTASVTLNIYQHVLGDGDKLAAEALEKAVSRVI